MNIPENIYSKAIAEFNSSFLANHRDLIRCKILISYQMPTEYMEVLAVPRYMSYSVQVFPISDFRSQCFIIIWAENWNYYQTLREFLEMNLNILSHQETCPDNFPKVKITPERYLLMDTILTNYIPYYQPQWFEEFSSRVLPLPKFRKALINTYPGRDLSDLKFASDFDFKLEITLAH